MRQSFHLYVSVFVASLGLGAYTYFIPVFAQSFGATFLDLGFIGSANALAYAVTPLLIGYLADKFNRAWLFTAAIAINALAAVLLALATSVEHIVLVRLLGGFGYGFFWPTSEVLATEFAPVNNRVKEMGSYSVAWASGFLIGPLVGGLVVQYLGYIPLFLISGALVGLALLPDLLWLVPGYDRRNGSFEADFSSNLPTIRKLLPWYLMTSCYGIIFGVIAAIFPGYANSVGLAPAMIGFLFTAYGISRVFTFATSERYLGFGEKKALAVVSAVLAAGFVALGIFQSFSGFLVSMVLMGASIGVVFPLAISLISRHFPHERLGAAVGSYETAFGIGFTVGPLVAGTVAALVSISLTFPVMSSFAVLMMIFVISGRTYPAANQKTGEPESN